MFLFWSEIHLNWSEVKIFFIPMVFNQSGMVTSGVLSQKQISKMWTSNYNTQTVWCNYLSLSLINASSTICRELVCITVKWTWYNGRDKFFHITSGRINTWKGVNQLKELFFLHLFFFFLNEYLKLTNHRYFMIKNPLFFTIHNKNGVLL